MSKIFISYRRQDSRPVATLIYEPLAKHFEAKFGAGAVFMDVHGIPLGVNFRSYLNEQVAGAELQLALIADRWLTAVDEHGSRRIDSPNDFVRIEIEAALKRGVPVVPVYVDDVKFLREADLPDSLKDLVWYNGYNLSTDGSKFAASIAALIAGLEPHFPGAQLEPPVPVVSHATFEPATKGKVAQMNRAIVHSISDAVAKKGKWINEFSIDFIASSAPRIFQHYFVAINGDSYLCRGSIVTGSKWDRTLCPFWRIVYGRCNPASRYAAYGSNLTYLGQEWRDEYAILSDELALKDSGTYEKFVTYQKG